MRREALLLLVVSVVAGCSASDPSATRLARALGSTGMVVSQIYGGGGNSGAVLTYDYLELFNRGAAAVNLTGWSVQYASAASSSWQVHALPATSVQPGRYFLIQLATQNPAVGAPLPATPDSVGTLAMSATNGKVAIVNSTTACGNASSLCSLSPTVVDFVGYGTASEFEGAAAPAPGSNNAALNRKGVGCVDTNNNAADLDLATWTAALSLPLRNSSSAAATCAAPDGGSDLAVPVDAGSAGEEPAMADAATPPVGAVVVSQIYGAGGNSGATYTHDYVELFNRSATSVPIGGWSIQYGTSANAFSQKADLPPGASIAPGRYFLVQLAGGTTGAGLPTPDLVAASAYNMSASGGKVALVANTTLLPCGTAANRCASPAIMDLVGYGGASDFEGAATTAASPASQAKLRRAGGCTDTDNNAADFETAPADARNSATPTRACTATDGRNAGDFSLPEAASPSDAAIPPTGDLAMLPDASSAPDAPAPSLGAVVVSQIYGAGGNSGAKYTHDYVELFNRGTTAVSIGGWSIQYGTGASAFSQKADFPAGTSLDPGQYYLVQLGGGTTGTGLPAPDLVTSGSEAYAISATAGKLALVANTTLLPCGTAANRCTGAAIMDLVGYGGAADFEGAATPAPALATQGMFRRNGGCTDTGNNAADFEIAAAEARNSATAMHDCAVKVDGGIPGDAISTDAAKPLDSSKLDAGKPPDATAKDAIKAPDATAADKGKAPDVSPSDAAPPSDASPPPSYIVVVSQLYPAGGNSGASYTHDYVELFNRGTQTVAVGGWSIQYGSAASDFSQKLDLPAGASLPPGGYYLVQLAGGSNGSALPTPDHAPSGTAAFNLSASAGKVALVRNASLLACGSAANRCKAPVIEDLVGYGAASDFESAAAPAPGSTTAGLFRKLGGCLDTNHNANDFLSLAAAPRSSASPVHSCGATVDSGPKADLGPSSDLRRDGSRTDALAPSGDLRSDRRVDAGSLPQAPGGCACEVSGAPSSGGPGWLLVLLGFGAVLLGWRRRRAGPQPWARFSRRAGLAVGVVLLLHPRSARTEEDQATLIEKGKTLWIASCPVRQPLCLKTLPAKRAQGTCAPPGRTIARALPRNPGKARAAQKLFARALALGGATAANARFLLAEEKLDGFLQVAFPVGLDFAGRSERSKRDFNRYLESKGKRLLSAMEAYKEIVALKDPTWSIASVARIGQLYHQFADALATAAVPKPPIPASLTSSEAKADFVRVFSSAYCDAVRDKATPLEKKAVEAYSHCEKAAGELGVSGGEWAKLCQAEWARIRKEGFGKQTPPAARQ